MNKDKIYFDVSLDTMLSSKSLCNVSSVSDTIKILRSEYTQEEFDYFIASYLVDCAKIIESRNKALEQFNTQSDKTYRKLENTPLEAKSRCSVCTARNSCNGKCSWTEEEWKEYLLDEIQA